MSSILTTRNFTHKEHMVSSLDFSKQGFKIKIRFISVTPRITQASTSIATSRIKYFFRKGNKISTEVARRNIFKEYSMKKNKASVSVQPKIISIFESFFISATPFIGLKTLGKRRGKITQHKVITLSPLSIGRKSIIDFSSRISISGRTSKPFIDRFYGELNTLYSYSQKRLSGNVVPVSTFYEKRALLYKTAYSAFIPVRTNRKSNLK